MVFKVPNGLVCRHGPGVYRVYPGTVPRTGHGLNMSVICGSLNVVLWVGNTWVPDKETPWHDMDRLPCTRA
ncbi:unnamed protein product [Oncorhynchus mykiss]|uniref:Uncharacterized protein n=1 Tax=Oncorhynchus mykiss TaxID=8022 RepID=A0A060XX86_ONCMY|nr:unnamed protein product [Oncorhynchus mykiss]